MIRVSLNGLVMKNITNWLTIFCVTLLIWIFLKNGKKKEEYSQRRRDNLLYVVVLLLNSVTV